MSIAAGDRIPDVTLTTMTEDGVEKVQSLDVLGKGKVVLFGLPGAFTPTCTDYHLPGFVIRFDELAAKGVDTIACISVNDAYVMGAWGRSEEVGDKVLMLADGNGDFARAIGMENDLTGSIMGLRSRRYAMIIQDGVVQQVMPETGPGLNTSSAEAVLVAL